MAGRDEPPDRRCDLRSALRANGGNAADLLAEGIQDSGIITVTGNTCTDALHHVAERVGSDATLASRARESLPARAAGRRLVRVTAHRRENFGGDE